MNVDDADLLSSEQLEQQVVSAISRLAIGNVDAVKNSN